MFIKPDFGFLCNDERDFTLALEALLKDAQKRLAMGKRAREVAEENSIQKNVWRWEMALMDVIENTRRARYSSRNYGDGLLRRVVHDQRLHHLS